MVTDREGRLNTKRSRNLKLHCMALQVIVVERTDRKKKIGVKNNSNLLENK